MSTRPINPPSTPPINAMRLLLTLFFITLAGSAQAVNVGSRVDNFRLLDHEGQSHELYYLSDMKAIVLMTHQAQCRASDGAVTSLNAIRDHTGRSGVESSC